MYAHAFLDYSPEILFTILMQSLCFLCTLLKIVHLFLFLLLVHVSGYSFQEVFIRPFFFPFSCSDPFPFSVRVVAKADPTVITIQK